MNERQGRVLLVDNGSLRPAAIVQLRRIARKLSRVLGRPIEPVSLLHSSAVPASAISQRKAEILEPALVRRAEAGVRDFFIIPLFIARSQALSQYLPQRIAHLRKIFRQVRVHVAPPLFMPGDDRLLHLLEDQVRAELTTRFLRGGKARVLVVDHGSPTRSVIRIRNRLTAELRRSLGADVRGVRACSMERRPGPAFAFNEPLLENLLAQTPWNTGPVVVAQLFILPGRHAGAQGDIAAIVRRVRTNQSKLRVVRTRLLGEHPGLIETLADRFRAVGWGH